MKIQIRNDLLNYNLSLKYIAEKYRVSITSIESEILNIISTIPKYIFNGKISGSIKRKITS